MAGVEKIKEKILQDSESTVSNILEDAKKQAEVIISKAQLQANEKAETIKKKALNDSMEKVRIANSMAELEMRKSKLLTKQNIIDEVFSNALERLTALDGAEYEKVLFGMLLNAIETGNEEVVFSSNRKNNMSEGFIDSVNQSLISAGKQGNVRLSDKTANIAGGFILINQGVEINNSFEALIRLYRDEIEPKVAQMLF
ncbi:MAG: H+transporting two-sector ATPase subunit [Clostridia bacterium]|jgi:V/A-type H+-transporting ATPase subunit E|nr:H+transporting two-sector ATPase subunit [Clostridia bacterium]MDF2891880.1 H+transporting two-sector ATPase subunit [Clostridia bacterium]